MARTLTFSVNYSGATDRLLDVQLDAERLSLPELGRYFRPLATINLEPAVDVRGKGTLDALSMDVNVRSSAGDASGPLVGHFGSGPKSLQGQLDVRDMNMAPILNRPEWKTRVTGRADFNWAFSPALNQFQLRGTTRRRIRLSGGGRAGQGRVPASAVAVRRKWCCVRCHCDHAGDVQLRHGRPAACLWLEGTFRNLDMRRLPDRLSMPKLETQAAGTYRFEARGRDWTGRGQLDDSTVEGARFETGTLLGIQSRNRELSYSASGNVSSLNPRRFAAPLEIEWLDDARLAGSLTGSLTFEGSGRTTDELILSTQASLVDSTLAGARFPRADVDFAMANREIRAKFAGGFEALPGSLFTDRKELADTELNGPADMRVALAVPAEERVRADRDRWHGDVDDRPLRVSRSTSAQVTASLANRHRRDQGTWRRWARCHGVCPRYVRIRRSRDVESAIRHRRDESRTARQALQPSARRIGACRGRSGGAFVEPHDYRKARGQSAAIWHQRRCPDGQQHLHGSASEFRYPRASIQADTAATFVTIAGRNLPRVTAKTTYEKNHLTSTTKRRRSGVRSGSAETRCFIPTTTNSTCAR